jgi:hypothetical protein
MWAMAVAALRKPPHRRKPKISATIEPWLLDRIRTYLSEHPERDLSSVVNEGVKLWYAKWLDEAIGEGIRRNMEVVDPKEWEDWLWLQRGISEANLRRWDEMDKQMERDGVPLADFSDRSE